MFSGFSFTYSLTTNHVYFTFLPLVSINSCTSRKSISSRNLRELCDPSQWTYSLHYFCQCCINVVWQLSLNADWFETAYQYYFDKNECRLYVQCDELHYFWFSVFRNGWKPAQRMPGTVDKVHPKDIFNKWDKTCSFKCTHLHAL